MTKERKAQILWWSQKVREQALMYADVVDHKRTGKNVIANHLDGIASRCERLGWDIKPPKFKIKVDTHS